MQPSPWTLRTLQDKFLQKDHLSSNGIAVVDYRKVTDAVRRECMRFHALLFKARSACACATCRARKLAVHLSRRDADLQVNNEVLLLTYTAELLIDMSTLASICAKAQEAS